MSLNNFDSQAEAEDEVPSTDSQDLAVVRTVGTSVDTQNMELVSDATRDYLLSPTNANMVKIAEEHPDVFMSDQKLRVLHLPITTVIVDGIHVARYHIAWLDTERIIISFDYIATDTASTIEPRRVAIQSILDERTYGSVVNDVASDFQRVENEYAS